MKKISLTLPLTLAKSAFFFSLIVISLGAFTRLSNAGLGCPDWPYCYGHLVVPHDPLPTLHFKAWIEMIHRYAASLLSLFILSLFGLSLFQRIQYRTAQPILLPVLLLFVLLFQALLGMWTVTLKLMPLIVMGHLLGGFCIVSLLWCLILQLNSRPSDSTVSTCLEEEKNFRFFALMGLVLLLLQIALGGWTSANYAGLSCIGFPTCNGSWLPSFSLHEAFSITAPLGSNFEGGQLAANARASIQYVHRIGALINFIYFLLFFFFTIKRNTSSHLKRLTLITFSLLILQIALGIINVIALLPLSIALLHHFVAALLLLAVIRLNFYLSSFKKNQFALMKQYLALCKLRVVFLMLITALVAMLLTPKSFWEWEKFLMGLMGIALFSSAAAVFNHVFDKEWDKKMRRTEKRPLPKGALSTKQALLFGLLLTIIGSFILLFGTNLLTFGLSLFSLLAYSGIYTLFLKHATPQNIVIGGASGAMPPLLGWVALTHSIEPLPLLLVLIIFVWTPAHFWGLAIYRHQDYQAAQIPMLPNTHGIVLTKLHILFYVILLIGISLLPYAISMTSFVYALLALILGGRFLWYAIKLYRHEEAILAMKTFRFSNIYLLSLFLSLLLDRVLVSYHLV